MAETGEFGVGLLIAAGTAGMLLLVVFLVLYAVLYQRKISNQREAHQQALLSAAIQSQEEERARIAKELHDGLQYQFTAVKRAVDQALLAMEDKAKTVDLLKNASALADEAIADTRRISRGLLPNSFWKLGLVEVLDQLCLNLTGAGTEASFSLEGEYNRLETRTELALFRVAQELLNNTLKHAGATSIEIAMNSTPGRLLLTISDNGKGFDAEAEKRKPASEKGLGLRNIESRLSTVNAAWQLKSRPGEGTVFECRIKY